MEAIKDILTSLREQVENNEISIISAAYELHEAGFTNYVDVDATMRILGLETWLNGKAAKTAKTLRRTFVHVYFKGDDGTIDEIQTYINLLPSEAADYYLGKSFPYGGYVENGEYFEKMLTAWRVTCYQVEEYRKGKGWKTIIDDVRKSYRLQGGQIVETTI